jgi:peptidoglycan/LPS O-acetylase OafA/YrhL
MTPKGRNLQLDVLRGVAILLVLCSHAVSLHEHSGWAEPLVKIVQTGGWTGVDLFFVLSGFLIGGLLFKEINRDGTLDARRFLVRRAFKIWPVYFVFLAVMIVRSVRHAPSVWAGVRPLLPNLVHLQNYFGPPELTPWTHTWSLAVEEHFYLALPLILLALCRFGKVSWIPAMTLVVALGCLALRLPHWNQPYTRLLVYTPTHLRADSLFFGVLLAYAYHLRPALLAFVPRARLALLACGLALIAPSFIWGLFTPLAYTIGFTLNYLGYGCILIACVDARSGILGRTLASPLARVMALIGFYSYSIYLWHELAREQIVDHLHSIDRYGAMMYFLMTAIDIVLAIALGFISAKLIEQPFLMLRDRIFPSHTPAGPVALVQPIRMHGTPPVARPSRPCGTLSK